MRQACPAQACHFNRPQKAPIRLAVGRDRHRAEDPVYHLLEILESFPLRPRDDRICLVHALPLMHRSFSQGPAPAVATGRTGCTLIPAFCTLRQAAEERGGGYFSRDPRAYCREGSASWKVMH